jgi:hypothetical protein
VLSECFTYLGSYPAPVPTWLENSIWQTLTLGPHEVHSAEDNATAAAEIPAGVNAIFLGPGDIVLGDLGTWLTASNERGLPISVPMAILPDSHVFFFSPQEQVFLSREIEPMRFFQHTVRSR